MIGGVLVFFLTNFICNKISGKETKQDIIYILFSSTSSMPVERLVAAPKGPVVKDHVQRSEIDLLPTPTWGTKFRFFAKVNRRWLSPVPDTDGSS